MNEHDTLRTPAEEDPLVHEWLSSLPALEPRPGFEDAVMARVWQPAPQWVRSFQRLGARVFGGRRTWVWLGGAAAASVVSVLTVGVWAATHWMQVETAWSVFVNGYAREAWRVAVTALANGTAMVLHITQALGVTAQAVLLASLVGTAISAACAWGLFHIVRNHSVRVELHASC